MCLWVGFICYEDPLADPETGCFLQFCSSDASTLGPSQQPWIDHFFNKVPEFFRVALLIYMSKCKVLTTNAKAHTVVFMKGCLDLAPDILLPERAELFPDVPLSTSIPVWVVTELIMLPAMEMCNNPKSCLIPRLSWSLSTGTLSSGLFHLFWFVHLLKCFYWSFYKINWYSLFAFTLLL